MIKKRKIQIHKLGNGKFVPMVSYLTAGGENEPGKYFLQHYDGPFPLLSQEKYKWGAPFLTFDTLDECKKFINDLPERNYETVYETDWEEMK